MFTKSKKLNSSHRLDMLSGSIAKNLLLFSLPIAASNILQQLFNSADTAVVGHFSGRNALAAVGANTPVVGLFIYIITGLALGANVYIARLIGEKNNERIEKVLHTSIAFSFILGIVFFAIAFLFSAPLLTCMGTPAEVLDQAVLYLRIYSIALPFLVFYNFGAAVLRSIGDTRRPMIILIIAGIVNVGLNMLFVMVFHMDVEGVAVATLIAAVVSAVIIFIVLKKETWPFTLDLSKLKINKTELAIVLKIGLPAALQSSLFSISNIVIQTAVNSFGPDGVAGASVGLNFELFAFYIIQAFSQATVTFVSQNYGAGNKKRCSRVVLTGLMEGMCLTAAMCIFFMLTKDTLILFYTTDSVVIAFAFDRICTVAAFEYLTGTYEITGAAIRGLGNSLLPALLTSVGTVCLRIIWVHTVFAYYNSFTVLFLVYVISWILTGILMTTAFFIYRKKAFRFVDEG